MPYNQALSQRIRAELEGLPNLEEKKMFGGTGFLLSGNMACGVHKESLVVRVGPEHYAEALSRPGARVFDITGRPMAGWVMVGPEGYASDADLKQWVQAGVAFARTLPAK
jgi:hypothetical protein